MNILISLIEIMALVVISSIFQKNLKIPSPITLMSIVMAFSFFGIKPFSLDSHEFDTIVLLTLPLLIATDAMKLTFNDLKEHGLSLFWVAVITVLFSIGVGVLINDYILIDYPLSLASVTLLFCMVAATDPITVSAVFSNFKVPHKLKILTEGESLFNDATALIVFSLAMIALQKPDEINTFNITVKSISVVGGAIVIGTIIGFLSTYLLKMSDEGLIEATILMLAAYSSYIITEYLHFSGILAVIVSILITNHKINKSLNQEINSEENAEKQNNWNLFRHALTSHDNLKIISKGLEFFAMFASTLLFVSVASIVNFEKLWHYKYEILAVFFASTFIRALGMLKFAYISNKISQMQSIQMHWWSILTFAGSKGALSILMVHMIPSSFKYKELFENIIIGVIILSTFSYAIILAIIFQTCKNKFAKEVEEENSQH